MSIETMSALVQPAAIAAEGGGLISDIVRLVFLYAFGVIFVVVFLGLLQRAMSKEREISEKRKPRRQ